MNRHPCEGSAAVNIKIGNGWRVIGYGPILLLTANDRADDAGSGLQACEIIALPDMKIKKRVPTIRRALQRRSE